MRRQVVVALALAAAMVGCVDSELVSCSDDRLCPRGTACDVVHHSCVAPDQLTVCNDLAELTSCTATGVEVGRCFDGVCLPAGCGNSFVEPEEICDDGNTLSGDKCSADCRSKEVCGDGFADKLRGEECDDGNQSGRDGCTNVCTLERQTWQVHLSYSPEPRSDPAAAYDSLDGTLVMFGGVDKDGGLLDDTWSINEVGWTSLQIGQVVRRSEAAMAYDSTRHRAVLFGGFSSTTQNVLLNDTWEWSGATWTRRSSQIVPSARKGAAAVFDGTRVIMFGGSQISDVLQDTWAWNGTAWTKLSPAHSPPAREKHSMTYDRKHQRVVLFGGNTPIATNDAWSFDGTDWTRITGVGPARMRWSGLAYDAKREVVVLSGVELDTNSNVVWELDGMTWQPKQIDVAPYISGGAVLAYDERSERVVQYGGRKLAGGMLRNEAWEWDGASWSLRPDPVLPPARQQCAIASDPVRGRVMVFGGQGAAMPLGDTWEWNGRGWQAMTGTSPPARVTAGTAFDGSEVVLFGGAGATIFGDTWRWNGQRWQSLQVSGPDARYGHAMVYDSKRARVILFGGANGSTYFPETWQWDGSAWTELTVASAPPPRLFAHLAYDAARDRIVMFGGITTDAITKLSDTWEFDGTTWHEQTPPVVPEERIGFSLVYDRMRKRVMLFGGLTASFSPWEWDGSAWSQPDTTLVPIVANGACATYDDARRELVAFGGTLLGLQQQTATGSYRGDSEEVCHAGADLDADGATGCDDSDCRMVCAPLCWDVDTCTQAPRCGDGTCSVLESEAGAACPADCPL